MNELTKRIDATRLAAGFSITNMQQWLGAAYSSVYSWCKGTIIPEDYKTEQIEERLNWLDNAIQEKQLPLPLSVGPKEKKRLITALRDQYNERTSNESKA